MLFAITPFVLLGYLRLFLASWNSAPLSIEQSQTNQTHFIAVSLTVIGISGFTAFLIRALFMHLSNALHDSMLNRVALAPMHFFNSTLLGRKLMLSATMGSLALPSTQSSPLSLKPHHHQSLLEAAKHGSQF